MLSELIKSIPAVDSIKELILANSEVISTPIIIDPSRYTTPDNNPWTFDSISGDFHYFKYSDFNSCVSAYERCPPVAAIINRKTQSFINGKTWVLNSKDKQAEGAQANKLRKLLAKPNPIQYWRSFEAQLYTYFQAFGFAIILPVKPYGFPNIDAKSLWNIPASWIDVNLTKENFTKSGGVALKQLVIRFNNQPITIDISELIIIKDIAPSFSTLTFPASKLISLELPINNIIGAYESRNVLINFRGALGILTQDPGKGQFMPAAMSDPEKEALQRDFKRYGLRSKQFQVILTTASLKWQSMGYATKDLMLMEEVEESTISICGNLNFPPFILGLSDTTYNNMTEAKRSLYEDATIPDAENIYEQLTGAFELDNIRLDKDYTHIPSLQENKKESAEARKANNQAKKIEWRNGMITLDEWRTSNGEDPMPPGDGRGKLYFPEYVALYGDPDAKGGSASDEGEGADEGNEVDEAA
jgi:hypothetical protein